MVGTVKAFVRVRGTAFSRYTVQTGFTGTGGGTTPTRPYFYTADWLWNPVPANPVYHANDGVWGGTNGYMAQGVVSCAAHDFGVGVVTPAQSASAARVTMSITGTYGNPFANEAVKTVPIPVPTYVAPMTTTYGDPGDAHMTIADASNNRVYSFWQCVPQTDPRSATYGGIAYLDGDGREYVGSSTATNISRYAGIIRVAEMQAAIASNGDLGHTLFIAIDCASGAYVYPAQKSDGDNKGGVAVPIPEGTRMVLDPTINVETVSGATAFEKVIMRTLQKYGCVVGDKGGSRFGLLLEYQNDGNPGAAWAAMGIADYQNLTHIRRDALHVLNQWNGT